jgi:hypothetical protein
LNLNQFNSERIGIELMASSEDFLSDSLSTADSTLLIGVDLGECAEGGAGGE